MDHPRRCGENDMLTLADDFRLGSPPQVRGKRFGIFIQIAVCRITPAGAGKTNGGCGCGY